MNELITSESSNIVILTGTIRSGKTTFLMNLLKSQNDCGGFLTPDINDKRHFFRLDNKECLPFELEAATDENEVELIGPYRFDKKIFELGNKLISNTHNIHEQLFVIDEVGKLELKGEGFDSGLKKLFSLHQQNREKKIILIVRDYLVDEVIKRYNINADIIDISEKTKFLNNFRFTY